MATEMQFGSLNGAALNDLDQIYTPNANAIARRSVSIFSRRGTETPEPQPPFIAQAAMRSPAPLSGSRPMTEKQKNWISRRRSVCSSSSPKSPKKPNGTILNAVPQAKTIKMTPLEEEMATSPNEEILSAVSEHSLSQQAFINGNHSYLWNKSTPSLGDRSKSQRSRETHNRIGVWVNGVIQWDEEALQERNLWQEKAIEEQTGFTALRPASQDAANALRAKPTLSVQIPAPGPHFDEVTLSALVSPTPQKQLATIAPENIVSASEATPSITLDRAVQPASSSESLSAEHTVASSRSDAVDWSSDSDRAKASRASSTSSLVALDDDSTRSKRSSATSVDVVLIPLPVRSKKRLSGMALTTSPPTAKEEELSMTGINKPLPPNPIPLPERSAPSPPSLSEAAKVKKTRRVRHSQSSRNLQTERPQKLARSLTLLDLIDREFMRTSPYETSSECSEPIEPSPTLSQAEHALHTQLEHLHEDQSPKAEVEHDEESEMDPTVSRLGSIRRGDSVRSVMHPPERAPTVPKRSRKREWRAHRHVAQLAVTSAPARRVSDSNLRKPKHDEHVVLGLPVRRSVSVSQVSHVPDFAEFHGALPEVVAVAAPPSPPRIIIDDGLIVVHGPVILSEDGEIMPPQAVAAASAQEVLLSILSALTSLDDLFSTAMINKGMYRVFKENEMQLIRTIAFNQSPAAWEFREWSPPDRNQPQSSKASSQLEHTPLSYMRCHKRDLAVIETLKSLILQQCITFIRHETAYGLAAPLHHPYSQRFNDAFWRIWCFCKIFGCGKNREDDVTGQLDWLKGGLLANNQGCVATVNTNLDFDMGSVLLNAPEHFAKGNANGLSAQQLYDMTEIWTCLLALLQGYQGRVDQARQAGVFAECDVEDGDIEKEEQVLEEWTHHLLTLGPAVVLEMAQFAADPNPTGFAFAKANGWTDWSPPQFTGTRSTFLKEPVSRLYEERVAAAAQKLQNPREQEKKETSRKRVASLAAEIRLKRQTSTYRRSPYIDMNSERPMSMARRNSTMSNTRRHYASPTSTTPSSPKFSNQLMMSPGGAAWSPKKISPIIEERVETFNRLSLQNFGSGIAEDTSELAVKKITEMGFSASEAKEALKRTDIGDGLRVDRAVELLLRQRG